MHIFFHEIPGAGFGDYTCKASVNCRLSEILVMLRKSANCGFPGITHLLNVFER